MRPAVRILFVILLTPLFLANPYGGSCSAQVVSDIAAESLSWQKAKAESTPASYEEFLRRHSSPVLVKDGAVPVMFGTEGSLSALPYSKSAS